jgi:plastocyanin
MTEGLYVRNALGVARPERGALGMRLGSTKVRVAMVGAVVGLGGVGVGLAIAQAPAPTVTVNATPTAVSLDPAGPLAAGPTRFNFVRPAGGKDVAVYVALLVPGVSVDQLAKTLSREDGTDRDSSLGLVSIQASATLDGGVNQRAVTFNVKAGLSYVVVSEEQTQGNGPVKRAFTTFTSSGDSNGATAAKPAATVRLQGLRFRGPSTLPRKGVVRFENRDGVAHFALAFPLKKGTTTAEFRKALFGSERAFGKVLSGAPYMAQNILSGGDTSNDGEVSFPKSGKYALVCFIDQHDRLGMYKLVTVK